MEHQYQYSVGCAGYVNEGNGDVESEKGIWWVVLCCL